jgi:hypothetical protein
LKNNDIEQQKQLGIQPFAIANPAELDEAISMIGDGCS